jgi:2-C-methyl-D-erythritol 2,4-cyclodiphosphate synthase
MQYKNIDSKLLLKSVMDKVRGKGYLLGNIDATICLQQPKVNQYIPQMTATLAQVLHTDEENISIKATTTEMLGFVGRSEGISAYSTVLVYKP